MNDKVNLNYATVLYLKEKIRLEGLNITTTLPVILKKLNNKVLLPDKIANLTRKIEKKVEKCPPNELNCVLHEELNFDNSKDEIFIGRHCQSLNINKETLNTSQIGLHQLSNNIVFELEQYRRREGVSHKELTGWLTCLCNVQTSVCEKIMRTRVTRLLKKRLKLSKNKNSDLNTFMSEKFEFPTKKAKVKSSNVIQQLVKHKNSLVNENRLLKDKSNSLNSELLSALKQCSGLSSEVDKLMSQKRKSESELKNLNDKYDIALQKISKLGTRNVNKRLKRMENRISRDKKKLITLKSENVGLQTKNQETTKSCEELNDEIQSFKQEKRKLQKKLSVLRSRKDVESVREEMGKSLRLKDQEINELKEINSNLNELLDECGQLQCFKSREEGSRKFKSEIQKTYMDLLSLGVSCRNCSSVIKAVLKNMLNIDVVDLPEVTFAKRMALQANLISKYQVASQLVSNSGDFNTLQFDGTSKWGEHFFTFDISTESGLLTASIQDVVAESSTTQLEAAELMFNELSQLYAAIQCSSDKTEISSNLAVMVKTIKNTMSDRGPTNKPFIKLFQIWREKLLPLTIKEWEFLDKEVQEDVVQLHDFYCGLHLLTNFAEYSNKGLRNFEELCSKSEIGMKSLGRFKHWKTGTESASQRLIRTSCELLQVQGNAAAGRPQQFISYLQTVGTKNNLTPFHGNRFNILFQNGRCVFGHQNDIKHFIEAYGQDNDLLKAVYADIQSPVTLAGTRALGLIDVHITRPLWHLLQSSNVSITDMSAHYQTLHDSVSSLCEDASPMLDSGFKLFDELEPESDLFGFTELHTATENADFDTLTIQALELVLASILVVIKRQLSDHLTGGKYENPSQSLIHQTKSVPKTNQSNESNFGQLERIKRCKPNASTGHVEGIIMYVNNKTSNWLSTQNDSSVLEKAHKLLPQFIKKWRDRGIEIKQKRIEVLKQRINQREEKEKKQRKEKQEIVYYITKYGLCKSKDDIETSLEQFNSNTAKVNFIKFQIKYFHYILDLPVADKELYHFSKAGHVFSLEKLKINLCKIFDSLDIPSPVDDENDEIELSYNELVVPSSSRSLTLEQAKKKIINYKRKSASDHGDISKKLKKC